MYSWYNWPFSLEPARVNRKGQNSKMWEKKNDRKNKLRIPFSSAIKIPQTRRTNDDESNDDVYEEAQRTTFLIQYNTV